ncbi:MAG: MBL fold metallo-hydrolase [Pseudomonadota bacterium]
MSEPISFVRKMEFSYGLPQVLSPLIRRVMAQNPGPFTFHGTGTYIVGRGTVAIIDPGPLIEDHVKALLSAIAGERLSHILITHTHRDHSPAAAPLHQATGAPVFAFCSQEEGWLTGDVEAGVDLDFKADHTVRSGDIFEGPGWTLEAIHTPGHMSNHLCFALEEEQTLFSGDHVMGWSTTVIVPPDGNMSDYMTSLRTLMDRPEQVYRPTHGPAIEDPKAFVAALLAHREARNRQILGILAKGSAGTGAIVSQAYEGLSEALVPAARQTVLAHLIHLTERNLVRCSGIPNHKSVFSLAEDN